ncbi:rap guanine nucleotide exchange factor 2 isoform X3 [Culicoides brevitarsis]|uniref:rap guanine nucleotide exchange factor 2 isoform X3 n=1 Tax=Culicoides brevitarsis TaxID=469753 RepID=UPI00307C7C48
MFLPGSSFGKRNGGSVRRPNECFVLETSEMIVIDYPENTNLHHIPSLTVPVLNSSASITTLSGITTASSSTNSITNSSSLQLQHQPHNSYQYHTRSSLSGNSNNNCGINIFNVGHNNSLRTTTGVVDNNMDPREHSQHHIRQLLSGNSGVNIVFDENNYQSGPQIRPDLYQKCNRGSHSSDTSSAYSGSDTMTSVHSSSLDADEVDLSGLVESVVDSDEDDLAESMDSLTVRDTVRECLEKDPSDRTVDDIETLLEFTQKLKAFTNMTLAVRRALCSVMVFAVVEKAGTIVMNDGEELDSWSVLINGHVEIEHSNGETEHLHYGDDFGILPTMDKLYHRGVMRTKVDDCQFVCITQTDYYRIQHSGEENIKKHEEDGNVVMVTELRPGTTENGSRRGHVVIRGTAEKLMQQLIEENSLTDPTYVEDFLLTHRTFIENPMLVAKQLTDWFENEENTSVLNSSSASTSTNSSTSTLMTTSSGSCSSDIKDRVARVVLLWVNNHFTDFETDPHMMEFLENFESGLEKKNMEGQLRLLHIAAHHKARTRVTTLTRSSRDEDLNFSIMGGYEQGCGVFISNVVKKSKAEDVGLKRGDQILEVNGNSFEHVSYNRAQEILMGTTHLSITVRSNLLAFKEMLQAQDTNSPRPRTTRRKVVSDISKLAGMTCDPRARLSTVDLIGSNIVDQVDCAVLPSPMKEKKDGIKGGFLTLGPKRRLQKALIKMNLLPKNINLFDDTVSGGTEESTYAHVKDAGTQLDSSSSTSSSLSNLSMTKLSVAQSTGTSVTGGGASKEPGLYHSHSNPDLTTLYYEDFRASDYPEHVLKVYKSDQTCKYLLINKETTAHEVVMLALQEFGIHESSSNFSLCEVSVGEGGMIKQRRLPDQLQNLAERIGLSSRYYLKTNGITETLVPDEMAPDLIRESQVHFLQLNANEIAIQLTFQDFCVFRAIEATEYIDDLFELKSRYGKPKLKEFSELVNHEMFWVVTEICMEMNIVKRSRIVKQFIKIARHCKECKNFNSMFAIISGLGHGAVSRLRLTWEKVPTKYQRLFNDLQELMDPSRNMSKYRQLITTELIAQNPMIPFYPVVKKDLTFIHLGNDTKIENLINFEKLRMIAKEVRILSHMCSSSYDIMTMFELKGQAPSNAMVALNQMNMNSNATTIVSHQGSATVKRRKKSTAAPNPKKMFEEAQMVRRVKAYLNNLKVITDEDKLHELSMQCEPHGNSAPNTVTIRKRHPSPTLSTTSSTSSTSEGKKSLASNSANPKFGAASPQAVKKILSLAEPTKTRPHQPRHIPLPGLNLHHNLHHNQLHTSPSPSPGAHRRTGSSSAAFSFSGTIPMPPHSFPVHASRSAVHERSHSDTPTPILPSVDLSAESSSVTSLSGLPLRKNMNSGSVTSNDSGHGSSLQTDNCLETDRIYHITSSIVHNTQTPSGTAIQAPQRRHSSIQTNANGNSFQHGVSSVLPPLPPHAAASYIIQQQQQLQHPPPYHHNSTSISMNRSNGGMPHSARTGVRVPPSYNVAAQMARLHRLGRAHSHEGVTTGGLSTNTTYFHTHTNVEVDEDDDAQVSAV